MCIEDVACFSKSNMNFQLNLSQVLWAAEIAICPPGFVAWVISDTATEQLKVIFLSSTRCYAFSPLVIIIPLHQKPLGVFRLLTKDNHKENRALFGT